MEAEIEHKITGFLSRVRLAMLQVLLAACVLTAGPMAATLLLPAPAVAQEGGDAFDDGASANESSLLFISHKPAAGSSGRFFSYSPSFLSPCS